MRRLALSAFLASVLLGLPGAAFGSTQTFTTRQSPINGTTPNMGWWSDTETNTDGNPTYATGWFRDTAASTDNKLRSYFTFKLDGLCDDPQSVVLELTRQNDGDKGTATLGLFAVSTSATALAAKGNNPDAAIFTDLGTGAAYGGTTVDTNSNAPAQVLAMPLSAAALAAVKAASGQYFSIGAALTDPLDGFVTGTGTIALFEHGAAGVQQLVVTCTDPAPANLAVPSVSGGTTVGSKLSCDPGAWTSVPVSFSTVWLRNGEAIPAATGPTYSLTAADQGTTISCRVLASSNGGDSLPASSSGTAIPSPPSPSTSTPTSPAVAPRPVAITQLAMLPAPKACVSRRKFRIRLRGVTANRIVSAQVNLDGRQVRRVTGRALGLPIDLQGLPKGKFAVQIVTTNASGGKLIGKRTYHTCVPKKR